jgi:hypothetical protein
MFFLFHVLIVICVAGRQANFAICEIKRRKEVLSQENSRVKGEDQSQPCSLQQSGKGKRLLQQAVLSFL